MFVVYCHASRLQSRTQVALKKEAYEDVVEWTTRALFIDPKCVKALFRRAMARKACHQYTDALADLQAGVAIEPDNVDLAKELRLCKVKSLACIVFGC